MPAVLSLWITWPAFSLSSPPLTSLSDLQETLPWLSLLPVWRCFRQLKWCEGRHTMCPYHTKYICGTKKDPSLASILMIECLKAMEHRPFSCVVSFLLPVSVPAVIHTTKPLYPSCHSLEKSKNQILVSSSLMTGRIISQQEANRCTVCVPQQHSAYPTIYLHICLHMSAFDLFYACFHIGITVEGVNLRVWLVNEDCEALGPSPSLSHGQFAYTQIKFEGFLHTVSSSPAIGYTVIVPSESRYVIKLAYLHSNFLLDGVVAEAEIYLILVLVVVLPYILKCLNGKSFKVNFNIFDIVNRYLYRNIHRIS